MNAIIENLKGLGRTKLLVLAGVGIVMLLSIIFMVNVLTKSAMSPLYSGLDPAESADIARVIEQTNVTYELSSDGTVISVPRSDFGRVRMALAENGLPSKGGVGYEIFDDTGALGMTSFMQQVNRLRALEGELARTIQTVSGVIAARVHLVLPEREAFSRDAPTPTASVVLRTRSGFSLERDQALAIRYLVASSVPNLKASSVTVMDTSGQLLLADEGDDRGDGGVEGRKASIESRISRNLEKLLSARVGAGNIRVQVSADLNLNRQITRSESFNPDEQVPRSTQLVEEEEASQENDDNVTVEQNLPMQGLEDGPSSASTRNRLEETINYEISNTVIENVAEAGSIERLSVAVLVNGEYITENGDRTYRDRDNEELERIEDLVRAAIGYNDNRGDTVAVESMQFIDYALDMGEPVGIDITSIFAENMMDIIRYLVALAALILIIFGLRPVISRIISSDSSSTTSEESVLGDASNTAAAAAQTSANQATVAATGNQVSGLSAATETDDDEGTINIEQVSGEIKASKVNRLTEIIESKQDVALKVMKAWIAKE